MTDEAKKTIAEHNPEYNALLKSMGEKATLIIDGVEWPVIIARVTDDSDFCRTEITDSTTRIVGLLRANVLLVTNDQPRMRDA